MPWYEGARSGFRQPAPEPILTHECEVDDLPEPEPEPFARRVQRVYGHLVHPRSGS